MARGKKAARAAQKRQCEDDADACTSKQAEQAEQASKPKRARKHVRARELTKQLFRKERARTHERLTKECAAQTCASEDEVSALDASPGAPVHAVFGARERDEYVDVSVQEDEGWQQQRPSRRRVYDVCTWADACLENVEARGSSESGASDTELVDNDFLAD